MNRRSLVLILALALIAPHGADAQQSSRTAPPRPALPAGSDTNSAIALARLARASLESDPDKALAAWYWASRLDPLEAQYVYAQWIARLLGSPSMLRAFMSDDPRRMQGRDFRQLDSLMDRALRIDPFFHESLTGILISQYVVQQALPDRRANGVNANPQAIAAEVNDWLRDNDEYMRPLLLYAQGDFGAALRDWADEARLHPRSAMPHLWRAHALFLLGRMDSARVELTTALALAHRRDADAIHFYYESKAAWEYQLGRIDERLGHADSAAAAYQRALVEDLGYCPAHVRLGLLWLSSGDTATALTEMARAVDAKEDEYLPRLAYAAMLRVSGRYDSAATQLERAIAIEPWTPQPRRLLGAVREAAGDKAGAADALQAWLDRAPLRDPERAAITAHVATLRASP